MEELKWMDNANCIGIDVEQFFPDAGKQYGNKEMLTRICNNCDAIKQCKDYSLRYAVQGWWGNTTERQRRNKRQQLNITAIQIVSEGVYR